MKSFSLLALTVALLVVLFIPSYLHYRKQETLAASFSKIETRLPLVPILKVIPESVSNELILPSFLDAINVTPILARTNGYLINWFVDIGDKVKENQLLATIDTPDVDQEVIQAEGDLEAALVKENITHITLERGLKLYECNPDAISKEELDQMRAAHDQSLADIEAAKGRLGRFKYLQEFKNIYAPFNGTITERDIDIGSLIKDASQQLFQIASTDILRVFIDVPQDYFHLIKDGMEAEITISQFPKKIFIGRIDRNAGALDPISRTLLTQINIDNKKGDLMPGLYAEVKLKFSPEKTSFIIPIEALIIRSGPPFVALVDENNKVHFREVKLGRDFGTKVEIVEGLNAGDEIIALATDRIKEGMEVRRAPHMSGRGRNEHT